MKITPERLNELEVSLPKSADEAPITEYNALYGSDEAKELLRLARLGLWVEQHGAKALDFIIEDSNGEESMWNQAVRARQELEAACSEGVVDRYILSGRRIGKTAEMKKYKALMQKFIADYPPDPKATATEVLKYDELLSEFIRKEMRNGSV